MVLCLFCSVKMLFRFSLDAVVQMLAPYGRAGLMTALKYVFLLFNVEMLEINKIEQTGKMKILCFLSSHSLSDAMLVMFQLF